MAEKKIEMRMSGKKFKKLTSQVLRLDYSALHGLSEVRIKRVGAGKK